MGGWIWHSRGTLYQPLTLLDPLSPIRHTHTMTRALQKRGFTLIELLITISIIAILVIIAIWAITANLAKARDSKRKADLDRLKIAFEDYYGDNQVYPPNSVIADCGSSGLAPYLGSIPCDPRTKRPYCYVYDADNNAQNYRIYSSLENTNDDIIAELECDEDPTYCGYENECSTWGSRFNYGVSSANVIVNNENAGSIVTGSPTPTPTPSPSPTLGPLPSTIPGIYACDPGSPASTCNNYGSLENAISSGCPVTWNESSACNTYCPSSPTYARCTR